MSSFQILPSGLWLFVSWANWRLSRSHLCGEIYVTQCGKDLKAFLLKHLFFCKSSITNISNNVVKYFWHYLKKKKYKKIQSIIILLSITSQVQNSATKKKEDRQVLQSFVSRCHAFADAWREKTGSQGHFAIKGFSDRTARTHTTQRRGAGLQLLTNWLSLWPSDLMAATFMLLYLSNLMWHKPLSLGRRCSDTGRYGDIVHNWLKCKTYSIPNERWCQFCLTETK